VRCKWFADERIVVLGKRLRRYGASDVQIESGHRAVCFSQLCCIPIVHFPSIMHPVRTPSFGSRSRSRSAICVVCVEVFLRTAHQWDPNLDMCHLYRKLCAIVQAEEVLRVQKLGGTHVQHRFDDYARRYLVSRRRSESIYLCDHDI
jgi:hypothetical protein